MSPDTTNDVLYYKTCTRFTRCLVTIPTFCSRSVSLHHLCHMEQQGSSSPLQERWLVLVVVFTFSRLRSPLHHGNIHKVPLHLYKKDDSSWLLSSSFQGSRFHFTIHMHKVSIRHDTTLPTRVPMYFVRRPLKRVASQHRRYRVAQKCVSPSPILPGGDCFFLTGDHFLFFPFFFKKKCVAVCLLLSPCTRHLVFFCV